MKTYGICESLTRQGRKVPRHVIQVVAKVDGDVASWASVLLLQQSPWSATYLHFAHFLPDRLRPCRRQCSSSICRRLCQRPASAGRPGLLWHQDISGSRSGANSSTQSTMLPTFRSLFASPQRSVGGARIAFLSAHGCRGQLFCSAARGTQCRLTVRNIGPVFVSARIRSVQGLGQAVVRTARPGKALRSAELGA